MRAPFDFGGCDRRRAAGLVGRWFRVLLMLRPTTERAGGRLVVRRGGLLVVVPLDLEGDGCCCCFFLVCCDLGGNFCRAVVALEGEVERPLEDLNIEFVLVVVCLDEGAVLDDAMTFRFLVCEILLVFMTTLNDRQCLVPPPCPSPVRFDRVLVRLSCCGGRWFFLETTTTTVCTMRKKRRRIVARSTGPPACEKKTKPKKVSTDQLVEVQSRRRKEREAVREPHDVVSHHTV